MKTLSRNVQGKHIDVDLLSGYLDNQVTPQERANIDTHLRACAACQTELQSLRQTVALLQALPRVPVPRAFTLSEAKIGVQRRAAPVPWFGGLARVAGMMAALVVVALISVTLLRSPALSPGQIARTQPTDAVAPAAGAPQQQDQSPAAAPAIAGSATEPAAAAATATDAEQPAKAFAPTQDVPPSVAPQTATPFEAATSPVLSAPAAKAPPATEPATQAPAAPRSATLPPEPSPTVPEAAIAAAPAAAPSPGASPEIMAATVPTDTAPAAAERATGRGGGGPSIASDGRTPEPAPASAPAASVLPATVRFAYADSEGVWAIDRNGGQRLLVAAQGVTMPQISSDGEWVLYRNLEREFAQLWVVRMDGTGARMVLDEQDLPKETVGKVSWERRLAHQDIHWVPGTHTIALRVVAISNAAEAEFKDELWNLNVETGALRKVLDLGIAVFFSYSPNGQRIAVLRRGTAGQADGLLAIYNADGTGERRAVEFKGNQYSYGYESQISWLPDSRSLWAAIPAADFGFSSGTMTLYKVDASGRASKASEIETGLAMWSPDGQWLAYSQPQDESMEQIDLVVARADGSNPTIYDRLQYGMFVAWAPDNRHFLYQHAGQTYLGAVGQQPQVLPGVMDPLAVRWAGPSQMLYPWDQGNSWALVSQTVGGKPVTIGTLPVGASYDAVNVK